MHSASVDLPYGVFIRYVFLRIKQHCLIINHLASNDREFSRGFLEHADVHIRHARTYGTDGHAWCW
jgi:hypothetical protein